MNPTKPFQLFLFSTAPSFIQQAVAAGIDGIMVDWEQAGKVDRQSGYDTQINADTLEDLRRVRACTDALVICRLNRCGSQTEREIEQAVEAGADELLFPMVETREEVERVLTLVHDRCRVGILIETMAAVRGAPAFSDLPLARVYVGLNDLAISRNTSSIFTSLIDGAVEAVRKSFPNIPFGFAGLTLPDKGHPVPCRLLMSEILRLGGTFSFLRRSFHRDIQGRDLHIEVPRIRRAIEDIRNQPASKTQEAHWELQRIVSASTRLAASV